MTTEETRSLPHRHANRARQAKGELHTLYRFYDADDELLYVGITCNPGQRLGAHRRHKQWWRSVSHVTFEQHETREALAEAEGEAIRTERPRHNIVSGGGHGRAPTASSKCPPFFAFDHGDWRHWPEYQALGSVIEALMRRFDREDYEEELLTQLGFEQVLADVARHKCASDCCERCMDEHEDVRVWPPYRNDADDGTVRGHYRCDRGHEWTCQWSTRANIINLCF